jgi:hypothetical protein
VFLRASCPAKKASEVDGMKVKIHRAIAVPAVAAVVGFIPTPIPSAPACDYVNVDGQCEPGPNGDPGNFKCCDGANSHATHRNGACSHHGGICGGSGWQEDSLREVKIIHQDFVAAQPLAVSR